MIIKNESLYHKLLFVASLLLLLFPAAQISGPFLADFFFNINSYNFFICSEL